MKGINREDYEKLLKELISIESPYFHEEKAMEFVNNWLNKNGVPARIHNYYDNKILDFHGQNVCGVMDSGKPGPTIYVGGHLDTVMLCNGWTKEPFEGEKEGDFMYGVGALDMKAGVASVMLALSSFAESKFKTKDFKGKVIYQFASVEEGPFGLGTMFYMAENVDNIMDGVDLAILTEPSAGFTGIPHPCICLGARGGYNYKIKVYGKSAHAATPELGISALVDASAIVAELEKIPPTVDEKLGKSAPCIIKFESGGAACSVPDYAEIEIFHHTVRGETEETIKERVEKAVENAVKNYNLRSRVEIDFRKTPCEGFSAGFDAYCSDENNEMILKLEEEILEVCGKPANISYFQSIGDFNHFGGKLGVPTVLFGPDGNNFHSADERVNLSTAMEVADTINKYLKNVLSD